MAQIIASTYEVEKEIDGTGNSRVYLAHHLRLGKQVVLKASKWAVETTDSRMLRREADTLKNLRHSYIQQVYDFIVEDDVAWTVLDYVEGENLGRLLMCGVQFSQAKVVKWGCELLEALRYLHSRPPYGILHGDIKPTNIILTPDDTVCLVDFSIALVMGEFGAAGVGYTPGYASPEQYRRCNFSRVTDSRGEVFPNGMPYTSILRGSDETEITWNSSVDAPRKSAALLDARSDIYNLGATLYHLFTGQRPVVNAEGRIEPLTKQDVSCGIADIVNRAVDPDPDLRYQTAADVLQDLRCVHVEDPEAEKRFHAGRMKTGILPLALLGGGLYVSVRFLQAAKSRMKSATVPIPRK